MSGRFSADVIAAPFELSERCHFEFSIFFLAPLAHSVEALTDVVLCVFPRSKLWDLYTRLPSLAYDLTGLLRAKKLIDENLVSLGQRTALERTAYLLLCLFLRAERIGLTKGNRIQFPFTQQHLADSLGMSLVHTNKTLKRLYSSGALRWASRVFELVDRSALAQIAGLEIGKPQRRPFI